MRAFIYLPFVLSIFTTVARSQHTNTDGKQLVKSIDSFTKKNFYKWLEFEEMTASHIDNGAATKFDSFRNNSFVKAFTTFTEQQATHYAAVRSSKFAQYAAPPPALLALKWDTTGQQSPGSTISHMDLFAVAFIRTFDPSTIAQITNSLVTADMFTDSSRDKMFAYYSKRDLFGIRIYARPIDNNNWQVWAADHFMALSFRFDAANGIVSAVSHTYMDDPAYAKIQWPPSVAKPANETERLRQDILTEIWNSYPANAVEGNSYYAYRDIRNEQVTKFHNRQLARYKPAREEQLRLLDAPPAELTNYKELTAPEDNLLQHSDSTYNAATLLYAEQWMQTLAIAAVSYFQIDTKIFAKRVQRNAISGSKTYARRLNDNEWEIMTISARDASSCIWNIKTGYARNGRYWVSKEPGA
ncbi:hypothetical protein [Chitinophaga sp. S165]|uniref:hypothetical protein n=1 Tax=Chitinophaga sp. S165 TaxID=2135462 RepID=UPI000D71D7FE|nr:hypothetical protein [Chitinophaga sp. S165]PWV56322.1 hypothetical protein C7475_101837 [Chitinophaga sp. S165]